MGIPVKNYVYHGRCVSYLALDSNIWSREIGEILGTYVVLIDGLNVCGYPNAHLHYTRLLLIATDFCLCHCHL